MVAELAPIADPELGAFTGLLSAGDAGALLPRVVHYRVRFRQTDLWAPLGGYRGHADDTIDVEVADHWLMPASDSSSSGSSSAAADTTASGRRDHGECVHAHDHHHHGDHSTLLQIFHGQPLLLQVHQ